MFFKIRGQTWKKKPKKLKEIIHFYQKVKLVICDINMKFANLG